MAVAFLDFGQVVVGGADAGAFEQHRGVGADAHGAAHVAAGAAAFDFVAAGPLREKADDGVFGRAEFGAGRVWNVGEVSGALDDGHLHAEADAEERDAVRAGEADGFDLAFGAAFAEAAGDEDAVHVFELGDGAVAVRIGALEDLGVEPVDVHFDFVGDAAVVQGFDEAFVAVEEVGVFADDRDADFAFGGAGRLHDAAPFGEIGRGVVRQVEVAQDFAVHAALVIGDRERRRWCRRRGRR